MLIHGELLYLSTSNGVDEPHTSVLAPQAPSLIGLDKHTGRLVATDDAARREMIGDSGMLVEGADSRSFAQAVEKALATDWGERPRQRALSRSVDDSAAHLGDLLSELARRRVR